MTTKKQRHFCFLQGNASPFFLALGKGLDAQEHRVSRINICGGDWLFWGDWNAIDYTGDEADYGDFVAAYCAREGVTDLVLHNDCRTTHRDAIIKTKEQGVVAWVFEEGYLRPNWLTLEKGGINGFSSLSKDPTCYYEIADKLPPFDPGVPVGAGLRGRVMADFRWQWANYRYFYRYPKYRTHRPYPIWAEYLTWAKRLLSLKWKRRQARRLIEVFTVQPKPYFVFPLQLDSDSQIRIHSPFDRLPAAIDTVVVDFATHAPNDTHLIIKNHPLDNGWINYARQIRRLGMSLNIKNRIHFIDGGDLGVLLDHARGLVTVNSTVGFAALDQECERGDVGRKK